MKFQAYAGAIFYVCNVTLHSIFSAGDGDEACGIDEAETTSEEQNVVPTVDCEAESAEENDDEDYDAEVPNTTNDTIYYSDSSDEEVGSPKKMPKRSHVIEFFQVVPSFWDPEDWKYEFLEI